jgi:hypothetical protein
MVNNNSNPRRVALVAKRWRDAVRCIIALIWVLAAVVLWFRRIRTLAWQDGSRLFACGKNLASGALP